MSIHIKISPEALANLRKQRRQSTILSIIVSILVIVVMLVIFGLLLLPVIDKESPTIVTYEASVEEEKSMEEKKVSPQIQRKPSAPASSVTRVIASVANTEISVPVPDVEVTTPTLDFGDGQDFGAGWGSEGFGAGSGAGGGGGFGSSNSGSGGLKGYFYALEHQKESTKNRPKVKPISDTQYTSILSEMQTSRFSSSMFDKYYKSEKALYLTNLAIPNTPSIDGPNLFGADFVQGRFWMAHYSGTVTVPKSGTYRFAGVGDNYLHVLIDGNPVMHYGVAEPAQWAREAQPTNFQSPYTRGWFVRHGKWVDLKAGQSIKIDIAIGEANGGMCGFNLELEEKNTNYRKAPDGRKILPLFTTTKFSKEEIVTLRDTFGNYEFDFEKVLVFPLKR